MFNRFEKINIKKFEVIVVDSRFEQEIIELLTPKIKSVLRQTDWQNQKDLEQELILMVLSTIKKKEFKQLPSFLNLWIKRSRKLEKINNQFSKHPFYWWGKAEFMRIIAF